MNVSMDRVNIPEILDSNTCPREEVDASLQDLCRINRWFGGVATTRKLIERVAAVTEKKQFSLLEVAAGYGEVPREAGFQLLKKGIKLEITDLDRVPNHLQRNHRALVADALSLPFPDSTFDIVSCSLFAHHLEPEQLTRFGQEACRVTRYAVLINDLIRHPVHLALVYAGFPLMRSYISRRDGVASVRRAYEPAELREILCSNDCCQKIEISHHYLFRMGVIVWKA